MSVECKLCHLYFSNLSLHLYYKHKLTGGEYLSKFPELEGKDLIDPCCWTENAQQKKLYPDFTAAELYKERKKSMSRKYREELLMCEDKVFDKYGPREKFKDPNAWNFLVLVETIAYLRALLDEIYKFDKWS